MVIRDWSWTELGESSERGPEGQIISRMQVNVGYAMESNNQIGLY